MNSSTEDELLVLIRFINETLHESKKDNITINTVSSLWIILFSLIIVQKIFKYVIKPCHQQRLSRSNSESNVNNSSSNHDPSAECIVL